jgi:hypothetical protein
MKKPSPPSKGKPGSFVSLKPDERSKVDSISVRLKIPEINGVCTSSTAGSPANGDPLEYYPLYP